MKSTRPLIDKIEQKDSPIQAIEIDGQVVCGSEEFSELNGFHNQARFARYIGNNKARIVITHSITHQKNLSS